MSFINALLHANIGYGIRRSIWSQTAEDNKCVLYLNEFHQLVWKPGNLCHECKILGGNIDCDLLAEDILAEDWEIV